MKNRLVVLAHENNIDLNFIKQYSSEYNKNYYDPDLTYRIKNCVG
jgi:hypothetical protein